MRGSLSHRVSTTRWSRGCSTSLPAGFLEEEDALVVYTDNAGLADLRAHFDQIEVDPVPPGWEDEWRRFHVPVLVGPLWIGPPWQEPHPGSTPVVIDPGRAFGTGAHETTRLCLELLLEVDRGSFLDVGCGSGVLAIAAASLGLHAGRRARRRRVSG